MSIHLIENYRSDGGPFHVYNNQRVYSIEFYCIEIILNQIKSLFVEAKSIVTCTFQEDQLDDVQQICPSFGAFAAVTGDGRVITWGDDDFGAEEKKKTHDL